MSMSAVKSGSWFWPVQFWESRLHTIPSLYASMPNSGRRLTSRKSNRSYSMKNFILLSLLFLSVACSVTRQVTPREQTTVEIRTETIYVPDTVYVQLPAVSQSVETLDTISVLENKYAISDASVSGNILKHSLEIKPVNEPVPVRKEIVYRDSVVLQRVDVDHYIEMPAELTPWQSFKIKLGGYAFALIILLIVCAAIYFVSHLKPFKL